MSRWVETMVKQAEGADGSNHHTNQRANTLNRQPDHCPLKKGRVGWALANANSQLISIVDLNQLTGPPQCKLFEQKQLSLSLNSHRSVPNSNLPAYLHPGWASPKCKVTSLVLTKLLPPLNCTPPLTITDPIAAFTGLLWNNIDSNGYLDFVIQLYLFWNCRV